MGEGTGSNAGGAQGGFLKSFFPGLVVGLAVGAFAGVFLSPYLSNGPTLTPSTASAVPTGSHGTRERDPAPSLDEPGTGTDAAPGSTETPEGGAPGEVKKDPKPDPKLDPKTPPASPPK